jgi:uncharacterized protein (DUF58 family)
MLLSPLFLKQLDALSLGARRAFTGSSRGEKRSLKRGASVEFADFRPYNLGDDIRRIDWNAYGRFEKLYLKQFLEEEDLDLTLILDASASMGFGEPSKFFVAQQIAAAIGYVALNGFDRVGGVAFDSDARAWFPPSRGRVAPARLMKFLESQTAQHNGDLSVAAQRVATRAQRSGVAVVLSDFLFAEQNGTLGYEAGLKTLAARGFEVSVLQILDTNELAPDFMGDFKLVDAEDSSIREVTMGATMLSTYKRRAQTYCDELRAFCLRYNMNYALITNDTPIETTMLRVVRGMGLVK